MDPATTNKLRTNGQIPYKQTWSNRRTQKTSSDAKHSIDPNGNATKHRTSTKCRATTIGARQLCRGSHRSSVDVIELPTIHSDTATTKKPWHSELNISTLSLASGDVDDIRSNGRSARDNRAKTSLDQIDNSAIEISNSCVDLALSDHEITEQITVPHRKRSGTWP